MPHSCPRSRERSLIQWSSPSKVPQTCPTLLCRMRSSMTSKSILAFGSIFPLSYSLLLISEKSSIFPSSPSLLLISEKGSIFPSSPHLRKSLNISSSALHSHHLRKILNISLSSSFFPSLHLRKSLNIPPSFFPSWSQEKAHYFLLLLPFSSSQKKAQYSPSSFPSLHIIKRHNILPSSFPSDPRKRLNISSSSSSKKCSYFLFIQCKLKKKFSLFYYCMRLVLFILHWFKYEVMLLSYGFRCQPVFCKYQFYKQPEHCSMGREQREDVYWDDVNVVLLGMY